MVRLCVTLQGISYHCALNDNVDTSLCGCPFSGSEVGGRLS